MHINKWIWQHPEWPNFKFDKEKLQPLIYEFGKRASLSQGQYSQFRPETLKYDPLSKNNWA